MNSEIGNKYGRLLVLEFLGLNRQRLSRWKCLCDCGSILVVNVGSLHSGNTTSCGCYRRESNQIRATIEEEAGNRYGDLVVISFVGYARNRATWLCQCDCGNKVIVAGSSLRKRNTRSCGCFNPNRLSPGEAALNSLIKRYKKGASSRSLQWDIERSYFKEVLAQKGYYCGCLPSNKFSS